MSHFFFLSLHTIAYDSKDRNKPQLKAKIEVYQTHKRVHTLFLVVCKRQEYFSLCARTNKSCNFMGPWTDTQH